MLTFPYLKQFVLLSSILLGALPAAAHVSPDMPDPIAEVEYQMMLDFEPDDLLTRYKLAMVYYRLQKDSAAETELQNILHMDANYFHALEGLGMLLLRQEKYAAATFALQKAVRHKKRESGTYFYLGKALEGQGKLAESKLILTNGLTMCLTETEDNRAIPIKQFQDAIDALQSKTNK